MSSGSRFLTPEEERERAEKKARELQVLKAEVDALKDGARIFKGPGGKGTVFLLAAETRAETRSALAKEIKENKRALEKMSPRPTPETNQQELNIELASQFVPS